MLKHVAATTLVLLSLISSTTNASPSDGQLAREKKQVAIDRCTAAALMLSAAYTAHPNDVTLRTERINREKRLLDDRLGTTDLHLSAAFGAVAFYDGKRISGAIPKTDPVDSLHLAAEGAARCMAALYDRGELYDRGAIYHRSAL